MAETNPVGRPPIEIDWTVFEDLCELQCTLIEIAGWFRCSEDTIENKCKEYYGCNFSDIYKQKAGAGNISLRRAQRKKALEGNDTIMQIFLGKNQLKQADKQEINLSLADYEVTVGLPKVEE